MALIQTEWETRRFEYATENMSTTLALSNNLPGCDLFQEPINV